MEAHGAARPASWRRALAADAPRARRPRPRALQARRAVSYLRLLLSVERPSDFFRGYRFVSALARRDNAAHGRLPRGPRRPDATRAERRSRGARRRRPRCAPSWRRTRRGLDADRAQQDGAPHLARREEGDERRLPGRSWRQAEARLRADAGGAGARGSVAVPVAAFRGTLPLAGRGAGARRASAATSTRASTPTPCRTASRSRRPRTPGARGARGHGGVRRPFPRLRPHGGGGPRRQAPHALRPPRRARRVADGQRRAPRASVLGAVGAPGLEGPGLYFEMRFQGRPEDPLELAGLVRIARDILTFMSRAPACSSPSSPPPHRLHRPGVAPRPGARRHQLRPARGLQRGGAARHRRLRRAREPGPGHGRSAPGTGRRPGRRQRVPRRRGVPRSTSSRRTTRTPRSAWSCHPPLLVPDGGGGAAGLARGEGGARSRATS